jgi:hypothetical protein
MTSFVATNHPTRHVGAERTVAAVEGVQQLRRSFSGTRGLSTLLLSALVAAVLVVADQVMDSLADGHLLVMWIALWAVAFTALALFAGVARNSATNLKSGLDTWSRNMARSRADERLMAAAVRDPRVMADLRIAIDRARHGGPEGSPEKAAPEGLEVQFANMGTRARRLARPYY